MLLRAFVVFCGVQLAAHGICADAATLDARRELSQQQQQDELLLRLQQNPRAQPLPQLRLQQPREFALEFQERQQQLMFDQHMMQQQDLHARQGHKPRPEAGSNARNELRRFSHERQQQLERFEWERQQLQQSFTFGAPRLQAGSR